VNASTVIEDETSQAGIVETHETGWCRAPSSSTFRAAARRESPSGMGTTHGSRPR
jgi:hypothetical protein